MDAVEGSSDNVESTLKSCWRGDPAAEALIEIGQPSVQAVVDAWVQEKEERRRELLEYTLREIVGDDVAAFRMERATQSVKVPATQPADDE